ncbi:MAG: hypothetical protein ACXWM7_05280 [Parachlamydiaceae bacterium]
MTLQTFYYGWNDLPFAGFFQDRIDFYPTLPSLKEIPQPSESTQPKERPSFVSLLANSNLLTMLKCQELSIYLADKELATKEWLQKHKVEMITYIDNEINYGHSPRNDGGYLVSRVFSRLDSPPDFIRKYPELNPETGAVKLLEPRQVTRKIGDRPYQTMVLNYLKDMINDPEKIERLVDNEIYENELARQGKVRIINTIAEIALAALFFFVFIFK